MKSLDRWAAYLSRESLARLTALAISDREDHDGGPTFGDACFLVQELADKHGECMVIGWQINDATGAKEPGWIPLRGIDLSAIEPVALVYPLERIPKSCKPKKS